MIPEQPAPQHFQDARHALNAVLAGPDLDIYSLAVVSDVLGRLTALHPLNAEVEPETPLDVRAGALQAIEALKLAAAETESAREIAELGLITHDLQALLRDLGQ